MECKSTSYYRIWALFDNNEAFALKHSVGHYLLWHLTASRYCDRASEGWTGFWPWCSQITGCNLLGERVARHWSPSLSIRIILL